MAGQVPSMGKDDVVRLVPIALVVLVSGCATKGSCGGEGHVLGELLWRYGVDERLSTRRYRTSHHLPGAARSDCQQRYNPIAGEVDAAGHAGRGYESVEGRKPRHPKERASSESGAFAGARRIQDVSANRCRQTPLPVRRYCRRSRLDIRHPLKEWEGRSDRSRRGRD